MAELRNVKLKRYCPAEERQELRAMEKILESQKLDCQHKLTILRQRRKEVLQKEIALKEKMIKCDKFIQDCELQRERAETIAYEEMQQLKIKEETIKAFKMELKQLQDKKEILQQQLKDCNTHQFLERVLDASNGEMKQVKDVALKYELLHGIHQKLWEQHQQLEVIIEEEKRNILQIIQDGKDEIININLQISHLHQEIAIVNESIHNLESELHQMVQNKTQNRVQYERMKMSISNMAHMIAKHCRRKISTENPLQQITKVQQYIEDLRFIITEIGKSERSDSLIAQAPSESIVQ